MKISTDKLVALMLARLCAAHGIRHAVLCPGSRNAPLNVAIADEQEIVSLTAVDERAAAFATLGLSLATGRPTMMVCTSGSALLDAAPALAEAYYRRVPLLLVSADRPTQWIDQDDSQTMRQPGALAAVVRRTIDVPCEAATTPDHLNRLLNDAITAAAIGPVHLNIQLDMPLGDTAPVTPGLPCHPIRRLRPVATAASLTADPSVGQVLDRLVGSPDDTLLYFSGLDGTAQRIQAISTMVARLAEAGVTVVAEFQSGLSAPGLLTPPQWCAAPRPVGTLVTIGGAPVWQPFKSHIRAHAPASHLRITTGDDTLTDTYRCLTATVDADPLPFVEAWAQLAGGHRAAAQSQASAPRIPTEARSVAAVIAGCSGADIHLGNGMAIRHAQHCRVPEGARVAANRGISGIDGSTSTAWGWSLADPTRRSVLITGDMSLVYDLGAFSLPRPSRLDIVVLANGGGDIFRRVASTARSAHRERLFCHPGGVWPSLPELCAAWQIDFSRASSEAEIAAWIGRQDASGVALLEVTV